VIERFRQVIGGQLRRVLLPLGVLVAMFVAGVPGAQALEEIHYYDGDLSAGGVARPNDHYNATTKITGNIAAHEGGGEFKVCESVFNLPREAEQKTCGINQAGNAMNVYGWWGEPMAASALNASGSKISFDAWLYTLYDELGSLYGRPSSSLTAGTRIESQNRVFSFRMQSDGNAVVYNNNTGAACWSTGSWGHPGSWAYMQPDGNFVVYGAGVPMGGTPYWYTTATSMYPGAYMRMQNDGNLVVYTSGGTAVWAESWLTGKLGC
jgi:hypothetical protein